MGKWYEVAVVSTCPHYMHRKRGNPITVALELKHVISEDNFTMTSTTLRNGSCKESSTRYSLTTIPGRFFHHVARFGADVYSFVVDTNYDEYAMLIQLGTEKPSGNKTTTVKLYSRTVDVGAPVLQDFKTVAKQHGMSEDTVIMNQYKGECVPVEGMTETTTQPQPPVSKRSKRNVEPPRIPAQGEYAGII
ncbi:protein AMBP-like isoform X2 [Mugil cephalus]|nr:protein AMBP-like isoform X2 [Mugil cephalus]XP_047425390.1 protein AMBP-like isoform X2 [Mugil cephalus]